MFFFLSRLSLYIWSRMLFFLSRLCFFVPNAVFFVPFVFFCPECICLFCPDGRFCPVAFCPNADPDATILEGQCCLFCEQVPW